MSRVKHTLRIEDGANSHFFDGRILDQDDECLAFVDVHHPVSAIFAAAPDLLAVASQPVVHIVEGDETIVRLMIGKVEVCSFERGDWRATALIMFDAEQRAAIARARGGQSQSEKEVGND